MEVGQLSSSWFETGAVLGSRLKQLCGKVRTPNVFFFVTFGVRNYVGYADQKVPNVSGPNKNPKGE